MESEVTVPTTRNKALCQWLSISLLWSQQQHTVCVCNCDHNSTVERDSLQQHLTWWNRSISSAPGIDLENRSATRLGGPGKNSYKWMEELQREEGVTTRAWMFSVQVLCTYILADCRRIDFPWEVMWVMKSSRSFKVAAGVLVGLKGCHSTAQYESISWEIAHISTHIHHKVVGSCSIADAIAKDVAEDCGFYGSEVAKPQSSRTDQVALAILANKHRKCGERCCFVESDLGVAVCF